MTCGSSRAQKTAHGMWQVGICRALNPHNQPCTVNPGKSFGESGNIFFVSHIVRTLLGGLGRSVWGSGFDSRTFHQYRTFFCGGEYGMRFPVITTAEKRMNKQKHNEGKMPKVWSLLVDLHKKSPAVFENPATLRAIVSRTWVSLQDPSKCPNCEESMVEYVHKLDFFNALLLKKMGDVVSKKVRAGMSFDEANAVHVVTSNFHDCVRHRTTQCRTLGLIDKVKKDDGKHDRMKGWFITELGMKALRGELVPGEVVVFRNKILDRPSPRVTIDDVLRQYRGEHKDLVGTRDPMEWVNFGDYHEGNML